MRLGDLLIQANLVTVRQVTEALEVQAVSGGRLGDHLVTAGAIERSDLDAFLHRMPTEPNNIAASKIDETELLTLLMKLIYTARLASVRQFVDAIKLPYQIVLELVRMAVDRQLLRTLGTREPNSLIEMSYAFTEEGRRWTLDALQQSRYAGPAPVTIEDFNYRVNLQKITNELITFESIRESLKGLTFPTSFIEQNGPALNSGRAILFYGPPGNGKTSVAIRFAKVFDDVIYVPYAIMVEGQIVRMYDPSIHIPLSVTNVREDNDFSLARREELDARWVPCRRPFVVTGGELTLEMLDLRFNPTARFYEAPLHMKALGGCFIIDDFGRQLVSPTNLLNRWIVPLESRVDYLKLHTGKTFSIPFEELVIFSTNLDPEDLMDPAFLRRLPYKIEVGSPSREIYGEIFSNECLRQGLEVSADVLDLIVYKITQEKGLGLAAFQPRFIVDQVVAACRFMGETPHFEPRFIDYAMDNLRVRRGGDAKHPKASLAAEVSPAPTEVPPPAAASAPVASQPSAAMDQASAVAAAPVAALPPAAVLPPEPNPAPAVVLSLAISPPAEDPPAAEASSSSWDELQPAAEVQPADEVLPAAVTETLAEIPDAAVISVPALISDPEEIPEPAVVSSPVEVLPQPVALLPAEVSTPLQIAPSPHVAPPPKINPPAIIDVFAMV